MAFPKKRFGEKKSPVPPVAPPPVAAVAETPAASREVVQTVMAMGPDERVLKFNQEPDLPWVDDYEDHGVPDPFKIPAGWTNQERFAYAWVDKTNEIDMDQHVYSGSWRIVNRSNHPSAPDSAFRFHGAVERRNMLLIYKPKELYEKAIIVRSRQHQDLIKANQEKFQAGTPIATDPGGKVQSAFFAADENAPERHSFTLEQFEQKGPAVAQE